ncbi:group I truncated hemoglobin [Oceanibacterium hippocampi]|uniref:Group 1 truncated hemoglobin GlbN n=1 Tax=Oceanibacterium hippocampi TaxID=745714 RepID=A0A1Y5RZE4_9PROT|nr:group 1 truncated hemoglobin [Oceanibacterium hippocampi]SLN26431.1 Group 1 truncated hemoglobin GlbN [Oceanibacterium hippocampi]
MAVTLFEKYGGFANLSKIIMAFYDKAIDSDVIGPFFDDIDMRRLVDHQTKFIASVMGGPVAYADDTLRRVHATLAIDRGSFDEMSRLLRETLQEFRLEAADVDMVMNEIEARAPAIISGQDR